MLLPRSLLEGDPLDLLKYENTHRMDFRQNEGILYRPLQGLNVRGPEGAQLSGGGLLKPRRHHRCGGEAATGLAFAWGGCPLDRFGDAHGVAAPCGRRCAATMNESGFGRTR